MLLGVDSALAYTNGPRCTNSLQLFAGGGYTLHLVDEIEHAVSPSRYVAATLLAAKGFPPDIDILFHDPPHAFARWCNETTLLIFITLQRGLLTTRGLTR